jgi:hypothetical protein
MQGTKIFCYGSNLPTRRLKERIGGFKLLGVAELKKYKLLFNKISIDRSGKANIQYTNENANVVSGIVIEITDKQKNTLDEYEGKGKGYSEVSINVTLSDGTEINANTYVADKDKINDNLKPYDWYKALVVFGALEHRFPKAYIDDIRNVKSICDTKFERSDENWGIIKSALSDIP